MKWNEMSVFHKLVAAFGMLSALAYLVLSGLRFAGILTAVQPVSYLLWGGFCLSQGILQWNTRRKLSVVWFVISGFYALFAMASLFI